MGAKGFTKAVGLFLAACTVAGALTAESASAQFRRHADRNMCFARDAFGRPSAGARGRDMGVRNAQRLFNNIFGRFNRQCDQLERVANIVAGTPLMQASSEMGACFAQGYVETLFAELDAAYIRCGDRCYQAGAEIGRISAMGYCAASAALGGLDDPGFIAQPGLPFCGTNIVFGCKTEYVAVATMELPACRPYTDGFFAETFDNTVRQDCFVPADVPIRDRLAYGYGLASSSEAALW